MLDPGAMLTALRFVRRLPAALRRRLSQDEALAEVRRHLARRADDFLALLRDAVYAQPSHPARRLLVAAGLTHADVTALVQRDGLEGALAALCRAGVYLTADELAGRGPVVRGRTRFTVSPSDLRSPWAQTHLTGRSSGSRSATPTAIALDLDAMLEQLSASRLSFAAAGCTAEWAEAVWAPPGSIGIVHSLRATVSFGRPVERWFSPASAQQQAGAAYDWTLRAVAIAGRLAGVRLPLPEPVEAGDFAPVLAWLQDVRRRGRTPLLHIYPSAAARLSDVATRAGLTLDGVWFALRGEPVTPARVAAVRRAGAEVLTVYGAIECGAIGRGCLRPEAVDEVHVHTDLLAVIQPGDAGGVAGLPADALLLTSLRRSARLILVNASPGDQATIDQRECGCPMQSYGWRTHLRHIRSFEKLTGLGMTFADAEVTPVLDEVLPARFGGAPADYQLVEEETDDGGVRLRLIVDPRLGPLDDTALIETFLDALARVSPTRRVMTQTWRAAGIVVVDRRPPVQSAAGKIMHFRRADRS